MGLFDVIKQTVSTLLDDGSNEDSLYSRRLSRDELLRQRFRLPDPETQMAEVEAAIFLRPLGLQAQNLPSELVDECYEGTLTLSESFVAFETRADARQLRFALPLSTVRRVKRRSSASRRFVLEITLYEDLQLVADLDGLYSRCSDFCRLLSDNLAAQAPLGAQLRRIATSFYSEFVVESANMRRRGHTRAEILAALAVPPGGLGREFGYPGDARASHERAKMRLWLEYFQRHGRNLGMVRQPQFYKLLRVGLPNALRGELWEVCSGAVHLRMKSRQLYMSLLDEHATQTSQATDEIAKDLNRSLPEFPAYQSPKGIERLRRVLTAYSWMAPDVGYCQAMNIVAAALLIFQTEEQAFWTLHVLVTRVLPGYYSRTMYGMLLDQKVLECLVEKTMPVLWHHFEATDVPLSVVSLPWFLSLFANSMPLPFAFRIIDILMDEGSRALFQVALAVLRVNGEELLEAQDNTAVIGILKSYFDTLHLPAEPRLGSPPRAKPITKFQELLVTAFKEFAVVTNQWIHDLRARYEAPVLADIESYAKRTQLRNVPKPHNISADQCGVIYDTFYAALQATRPGLGGIQGELTFYQFVTFLSQLVDWVHPRIVAREDAEHSQLLRRLFADWDSRSVGSLTLADCVAGLDCLVNRDMMEVINYFFGIFAKSGVDDVPNRDDDAEKIVEKDANGAAKDTHDDISPETTNTPNTADTSKTETSHSSPASPATAKLNQQSILDVADGMLMMMRPFSETHDGAIVLDAETSKKFAHLTTPRRGQQRTPSASRPASASTSASPFESDRESSIPPSDSPASMRPSGVPPASSTSSSSSVPPSPMLSSPTSASASAVSASRAASPPAHPFTHRQTSPPPLSEEQKQALLAKLQQDQSAKYLGAVSSFIQRSYEVAGYKLVLPQVGKAAVSEAEPLISLDDNDESDQKHSKPNNDDDINSENGLGIAHFRMVLLADETLEMFFSETLRTTIHLTEQGTGVLSNKFGANTFRSVMGNVMREGLQLADGLWRNNALTDARIDELDDDTTVKASDRALLDI